MPKWCCTKKKKNTGRTTVLLTHKQASKLHEINYRIAFVLCLLFYIVSAHPEITEFHFIFLGAFHIRWKDVEVVCLSVCLSRTEELKIFNTFFPTNFFFFCEKLYLNLTLSKKVL